MDFKSIALTSRPRLRLAAALQLPWLQEGRTGRHRASGDRVFCVSLTPIRLLQSESQFDCFSLLCCCAVCDCSSAFFIESLPYFHSVV